MAANRATAHAARGSPPIKVGCASQYNQPTRTDGSASFPLFSVCHIYGHITRALKVQIREMLIIISTLFVLRGT